MTLIILMIFNQRPNRGGLSGQVEQLIWDLRSEGLEIKICSTTGSPFYRLFVLVKAFYLAKEADLILAAGSAFRGFFPCSIASIVSRVMGKPVIYNYHDGQVEKHLKSSSKLINWIFGKNYVVVATEYLKNAFISHGITAVKIDNHFNFSDLFPSPAIRPKTKIRKVVWARAFHDLYQPELALQIANASVHADEEIIFDFYGNGPLFEGLRSKYNHPRIRFKGLLNREVYLREIAEYNILLNTTKYDNFPLSIVEAAFNRIPVVSTKVGGIATIFNDEEMFFFQSIEEACTLIQNLFSLDEKNFLIIENARKKVESFVWDNVRQDWLNLISEMVERAK